MVNKKDIPLLKGDAYRKLYFEDIDKNDRGRSSGFHYFRIDRRTNLNHTIKAHRLDFYQVFLVTGGEGIQTFGTEEYYIRQNMLCFVSPDMITSWQSESDEHQGYLCSFSSDFFNLGRENKQLLEEFPFFQIDGCSALHLTDEQTQYFLSLLESMNQEFGQKNKFSEGILRSQLQLFLYKAYAQFNGEESKVIEANPAGLRITKAFKRLYISDFESLKEKEPIKLKTVAEYADQLGVTQNHLNDTVRSVTGKSAGQLIKDHLIDHATMCLKNCSLDIGEIAFMLGYGDPSYFSRYYKKQTGQTPSSVR